jgi:uncharacterized membrane protein
MSTTETSSTNVFFDSSTLESRRHSLRRFLVMFLVAGFGGPFLAGLLAPISPRLEEASVAEIELIPEWHYWTGMAALVALMAVGLFGVYRLWKFKWDGVGYLAFSLFFPIFLMLPIPSINSAFGYYVESIANMITGMLLFACWINRDAFEPAPESTSAVAIEGGSSGSPAAP